MEEQYVKMAKVFKALSDPKRVQIVDVLSGGEVCGCALLEHFHITQPTLSHDMKLLIESGIVQSRRDGQRTLYSLNMEAVKRMQDRLKQMLRDDAK
ncbi:MAG: helix-turn-helix transcriptional regulator [Clostridia bacterium]|nr:helix-turn-helix transcriptional regulator [Clostridia bacterium]